MMPPGLEGIVERLAAGLGAEQIVLFGSYARGTARPGSDIDLLVVAPFMGEPARHLRRARQLVWGSFPPVDLVLSCPADLAAARAGQAPFLLSVIESGIIVYPRRQQPGHGELVSFTASPPRS